MDGFSSSSSQDFRVISRLFGLLVNCQTFTGVELASRNPSFAIRKEVNYAAIRLGGVATSEDLAGCLRIFSF